MSSDVHAKCTNSRNGAAPATPASRCLSQYSTALTSWLVSRSMTLTLRASSGVNAVPMASSARRVASSNAGTSLIAGSSASAQSQAISMRTRWRISANSLKWSASVATLAR